MLLEGILKLLSTQELLEFMTPEEIRGPHGLFGVGDGQIPMLSWGSCYEDYEQVLRTCS